MRALAAVACLGLLLVLGACSTGGEAAQGPSDGSASGTATVDPADDAAPAGDPDAPITDGDAGEDPGQAESPDAAPDEAGEDSGSGEADGLLGKYTIAVYPGMQELPGKVEFEWPGIARYILESHAEWEYYSSADSFEVIAAYYRETMSEAPYDKKSVNVIDIDEGVMSQWFDADQVRWIRVWTVSRPDGPGSYVIFAVDDGLTTCG